MKTLGKTKEEIEIDIKSFREEHEKALKVKRETFTLENKTFNVEYTEKLLESLKSFKKGRFTMVIHSEYKSKKTK